MPSIPYVVALAFSNSQNQCLFFLVAACPENVIRTVAGNQATGFGGMCK